MRCRRESKECFFSATRRKRKNEDDAEEYQDEYIIRNGRKRHYLEDTPPVVADEDRKPFNPVPLTPGGSAGQSQPLRRTHGHTLHDVADDDPHRASYAESIEDSNAQLENLEAQNVMRKGVYGPHDALDLLYKAATDRYVHPSLVLRLVSLIRRPPSSPAQQPTLYTGPSGNYSYRNHRTNHYPALSGLSPWTQDPARPTLRARKPTAHTGCQQTGRSHRPASIALR